MQLGVVGSQLVRMDDAQMHDSAGETHPLNVREHSIGQRENARQNPHAGRHAERTLRQRHLVDAHRVDDGAEAVSAERGQREDGHAEGERLQELVQLAHGRAEAPLRKGVDGGRERNGHQQQQQVTARQAHDVHVRGVAHVLVTGNDVDEGAVTNHTHDEDDDKENRHYVSLWTIDEQWQRSPRHGRRLVRRVCPFIAVRQVVVHL